MTATVTNRAPIPMECDAPFLKVVGELPRELNGTLYRNGPNPQFEVARRALVRRRRHAARLPSRERPRQLPQPLGPHPEMAGRTRRRPRAVRRLRPEAAGRAGLGHPRRRRRQHQHHVSRRTPAGAGGGPSADRDRARYAEDRRGYCDYRRQHRRAVHRASQDRSGDRRDGVLRLQCRRTLQPRPLASDPSMHPAW